MGRFIVSVALACSGAQLALAEPLWEEFAAPSVGNGGALARVSPGESGLEIASLYRDERAWTDRLEPATIGAVGTGVGSGDFDGDGYPDLFVAMREGRNRLYLNEGGRRFVDYSDEAGILGSPDWTTGVTVADIDGDGWSDIYVCFFDAPNRLYLNRGDATFEEKAGEFGLDARDACSGAFFADYDRDGDLDLYLQTNVGSGPIAGPRPDFLLRNEGPLGFVDMSGDAGILRGAEGSTLGHSVLWIDYDGNGWEDIYVANDFKAADFLYLNNGDGTFRFASDRIPVAPYSSMGSDIGDVNGDGRFDILTTDMATPSYVKHVESMLTSGVKTRELASDSFPAQTMKNALLLNRGGGHYVDTAYAWNVAATDWTWAVRLADLDNDGWLDAVFTNGMIRQFHNADLALAQDRQKTVLAKTAVFRTSPVLDEDNLVFRNMAGRGFQPANERWGFQHRGVSFGAALLDFDRDGDWDFVYTNYEAPPTLWRNDLGAGNAVQLRLVGVGRNKDAVGAVAVAMIGDRRVAQKILSNRGYLGSDEKLLHFGLGEATDIDDLEIRWPDGSRQKAHGLRSGRRYTIHYAPDGSKADGSNGAKAPARFVWQRDAEAVPARRVPRNESEQTGLLYPLKAIPGEPKERLLRADFDGDGREDVLILRDWDSPRLILSRSSAMADASESSGFSSLSGIWTLALVDDFNGDNQPDVLLGGVGLNNEFSFRSEGEGHLVRRQGRFSSEGPLVNLNAYKWKDGFRLFDGLRDYAEIDARVSRRIPTFRQTGEMTVDAFLQTTGFLVERTFEVSRFRSLVMVNVGEGRFRAQALPLEAQYGRVWDAAAGDIDDNGTKDLVLLLGQVSPHVRSGQAEASFLSVVLGKADGTFAADTRRSVDRQPGGRAVGISLTREREGLVLEVTAEDGSRLVYRALE